MFLHSMKQFRQYLANSRVAELIKQPFFCKRFFKNEIINAFVYVVFSSKLSPGSRRLEFFSFYQCFLTTVACFVDIFLKNSLLPF